MPRAKRDWFLILEDAAMRGVTPVALAKEVGVTLDAVRQAEDRIGITLPRARTCLISDKEWRAILMDAKCAGKSARDIVSERGVYPQMVYAAEKRCGIFLVKRKYARTSKSLE